MSLKSVLCIIFCRLTSLSWFQLNLLITNILADPHQLILLLSECLALDFIQDQEPVKKGPLGAHSIDSDHQSDC